VTYRLRLVVRLKDGRTLSGTYPYLVAIGHAQFCEQSPDLVASWKLEALQ
jgi:hypothetical protein